MLQRCKNTYKPLVYVDCFAGKGKFEDGKPGSPLIALDIIDECLTSTKMTNANVRSCFIDLNYASDLTQNLIGYQGVQIIAGKYETEIKRNICLIKLDAMYFYI